MDYAFSFIVSNGGLHKEEDYPYLEVESTCENKRVKLPTEHWIPEPITSDQAHKTILKELWKFHISFLQGELEVVTISGYKDVPENNEASLIKALAHQPLSVAIEASGRDFQFYSGVSKIWNSYGHCWYYYLTLMKSLTLQLCTGRFWWTLWNRAWSWSHSRWIWIIKGSGLYHCEEFMGTQMGRERIYKNEEEHWEAWRALWNQ